MHFFPWIFPPLPTIPIPPNYRNSRKCPTPPSNSPPPLTIRDERVICVNEHQDLHSNEKAMKRAATWKTHARTHVQRRSCWCTTKMGLTFALRLQKSPPALSSRPKTTMWYGWNDEPCKILSFFHVLRVLFPCPNQNTTRDPGGQNIFEN